MTTEVQKCELEEFEKELEEMERKEQEFNDKLNKIVNRKPKKEVRGTSKQCNTKAEVRGTSKQRNTKELVDKNSLDVYKFEIQKSITAQKKITQIKNVHI